MSYYQLISIRQETPYDLSNTQVHPRINITHQKISKAYKQCLQQTNAGSNLNAEKEMTTVQITFCLVYVKCFQPDLC